MAPVEYTNKFSGLTKKILPSVLHKKVHLYFKVGIYGTFRCQQDNNFPQITGIGKQLKKFTPALVVLL